MKPVTIVTGVAAPLIRDNIDTDTIIPSREMKSTGKTGLAEGLFAPWRYTDAIGRVPDPTFILNQDAYKDAKILISGANFGCGSSREHAVWALCEYGIICIIAESFAPIFYNNCTRNSVLPIVLDPKTVQTIAGHHVTIDLAAQSVTCGDDQWTFDIEAQAKAMLLHALDAIDLTLHHSAEIAEWLTQDKEARPWVYLSS